MVQHSETMLEKQLRKAKENYGETNFFKAICCYNKVSIHLFTLGDLKDLGSKPFRSQLEALLLFDLPPN